MITQHSACTLTRLPARTGKRTSARGNRWGLFPDTTSDLCAATSRELKTNRVKHGITETGTIGLPWLKRVLPCNASTGMSAVELTNRCDSTLAPRSKQPFFDEPNYDCVDFHFSSYKEATHGEQARSHAARLSKPGTATSAIEIDLVDEYACACAF